MAESLMSTFKRGYVTSIDRSNAAAVLASCPTHSGTSASGWGTSRRARLGNHALEMTLTERQAVSGMARQDQRIFVKNFIN